MALKDLVRPGPSPAEERPPGITCESYSKGPDGKRCAHYLDKGACALPTEFMCVEWLKRNGPPPAEPAPVETAPATSHVTVQHALFGLPSAITVEPPKPKPAPAMVAPAPAEPAEPSLDVDQLRGFTTDDIESFKALGVEVQLESEAYGELWLVPAYTGADRREITPEHAATLARVMSVFPGSRVTAFHKSTNSERPERPAKERS